MQQMYCPYDISGLCSDNLLSFKTKRVGQSELLLEKALLLVLIHGVDSLLVADVPTVENEQEVPAQHYRDAYGKMTRQQAPSPSWCRLILVGLQGSSPARLCC